jgi:hypothetical protein
MNTAGSGIFAAGSLWGFLVAHDRYQDETCGLGVGKTEEGHLMRLWWLAYLLRPLANFRIWVLNCRRPDCDVCPFFKGCRRWERPRPERKRYL